MKRGNVRDNEAKEMRGEHLYTNKATDVQSCKKKDKEKGKDIWQLYVDQLPALIH